MPRRLIYNVNPARFVHIFTTRSRISQNELRYRDITITIKCSPTFTGPNVFFEYYYERNRFSNIVRRYGGGRSNGHVTFSLSRTRVQRDRETECEENEPRPDYRKNTDLHRFISARVPWNDGVRVKNGPTRKSTRVYSIFRAAHNLKYL